MSLEVIAENCTSSTVDIDHWSRVLRECLVYEGVDSGTVSLLFVDREEMVRLNEEHMDSVGPTDVLSFPIDDPDSVNDNAADGPPSHIGDIVLCPVVIEAQACSHTGSVPAEYTLLIVHAVLHLLGHDHYEPSEQAKMQAQEKIHMDRYGYRHPQEGTAAT